MSLPDRVVPQPSDPVPIGPEPSSLVRTFRAAHPIPWIEAR